MQTVGGDILDVFDALRLDSAASGSTGPRGAAAVACSGPKYRSASANPSSGVRSPTSVSTVLLGP
jgi:hypothetical protein